MVKLAVELISQYAVGDNVDWLYDRSESGWNTDGDDTIGDIRYNYDKHIFEYRISCDSDFNFDEKHIRLHINKDIKKMTVSEISKELGYDIKIVK